MKIKPPSRKHRVKAMRKQANPNGWWLVQEEPKKQGRLGQLNKHNRKTDSEFVIMAKEGSK